MKLTLEAAPIIEAIKSADVVILDTETKSLHVWRDGKILAGVGVKPLGGPKFYLPIRHSDSDNAPLEEVERLCEALRGKMLVGHNLPKFDLAVLWNEGIDLIDEETLDTVVLWRLVSEDEPNYELKRLAKKYIDPNAGTSERILKKLMKEHGWETYDQVPVWFMSGYTGDDLDYAEGLYKLAMPVIEERGLSDLLEDEKRAARALFHMERTGFTVDGGWIKRRRSKLEKLLTELERECYSEVGRALVARRDNYKELNEGEFLSLSNAWELYAGYTLNLQSANDLKKVFHGLGVHSDKVTPGGDESWDKNVLADIAKEHPLAALIVRHRSIGSIKEYYDDFTEMMDSDKIIHCSMKQAGARTGRYACAQPNLQNIPKLGTALTGPLTEEEQKLFHEVRGAFVPSEGRFLLFADWSLLELRILADYADEPELLRAFELGLDLHALTARVGLGELSDNADETLRKWWRNAGKVLNFGTIYGMGDETRANHIGRSKEEAREFKTRYLQRFPGIKKFDDKVYDKIKRRSTPTCRAHKELCPSWCAEQKVSRGWLQNLWGRRRYLTEEESYKGINFLVSGTAADLMREVNWRLHHALLNFKTPINLIIHDEFIFDMPYDEVQEAIPIIVQTMEACNKLKVPLKADLKWTPERWSKAVSLDCDNCDGFGKTFGLPQDEIFEALVRNDKATLDSLVPTPCEACEGAGYDLRKIKGVK